MSTGDQKRCSGERVEELDMEVRGRFDDEWSLLHWIWESIIKASILERGYDQGKARVIRRQTHTFFWCTGLQGEPTLLIQTPKLLYNVCLTSLSLLTAKWSKDHRKEGRERESRGSRVISRRDWLYLGCDCCNIFFYLLKSSSKKKGKNNLISDCS